jgi:hypothetical protein
MVATKRGLEHCVEALLVAGANANFHGNTKYRSPLLLAVFFGFTRIVELLLKFGANPNFQYSRSDRYPHDVVGDTRGIVYAIQLTDDKPEIRAMLLAAGAQFHGPPAPPDPHAACQIL